MASVTEAMVREKLRVLEPLAPEFECIDTDDALEALGDAIVANGVVALDTETTGLSEWRDHVVGLCAYTPGRRAAYIPVQHRDALGNRLAAQCSLAAIDAWLRRVATVTTVFHHAKFDVKMLWTSFGIRIPIGWDTQIAGELLNENEAHGLKALWMKYCMAPGLPAELVPQDYDTLFDDIQLATLDPRWMYIYGARDAKMTYELYEFQRPFLTGGDEMCVRQGLVDTAVLYHNTELPLIDVFIDMERTGFAFDADYAAALEQKYVARREQLKETLDAMAASWDWSGVPADKLAKIGQPPNWGSATQMAIIAYDLAQLPSIDPQHPRGTGSPILERWARHPKVPKPWQQWAATMIDYREHAKLINTYLQGFPALVEPTTGRIHPTFYQNGSVTGRMCIAKGMPVALADGGVTRAIEDIEAGDRVVTFDGDGQPGVSVVTWAGRTGHQETIKVHWQVAAGCAYLQCTAGHEVRLVDGTWRAAGDLVPGDRVLAWASDGGPGRGRTLTYEVEYVEAGGLCPVYDVEVVGTHCFIAGGVAVHNSSRNPNAQNLPRDRAEIRGMVRATPGYYLVSADYSQIEPRGLAHLSKDPAMQAAYREGRDLYAAMASAIWNLPYEDCVETRPDGTVNAEAKKRRTAVKSILLGIMYGRGGAAIAEQLGVSTAEGNRIVDKFFDTFPAVKTCIDNVQASAREVGYVQTFYGRKRRLPELRLPPYALFDAEGRRAPPAIEGPAVARLKQAWSRARVEAISHELREKGWRVDDHMMEVSHAGRQCLNSILQGSSADITKRAMVAVAHDELLTRYGFRMLTSVHDEIVGEAPQEYAVAALERLEQVMVGAVTLDVPVVVDGEITERWGGRNLLPDLRLRHLA